MKYLLIICLVLSGCSDYKELPSNSPFKMSCDYVGNSIIRCENNEVVCYRHTQTHGFSCLPKVWMENRD